MPLPPYRYAHAVADGSTPGDNPDALLTDDEGSGTTVIATDNEGSGSEQLIADEEP